MTTRETSLRNSTGRSKRASTVRLAPKSNGARPTSRPWTSSARTEPVGRSARVGAREPRRQGARLIVGAGERERAPVPSVTTSTERAMRREPGRKGARAAELDPVGDPQNVGLRLAREKALDRRQRRCARPAHREPARASADWPSMPACRGARRPVRACDSGLDRDDSTAPRRRLQRVRRAKSIRLSQAGAAANPSSITTSSGPDPESAARLFHSGSAMARMISAPIARRSARIGHGVRAGVVSFGSSPMSRRSGGNMARRGLRRRDAQQEIERRRGRRAPPARRARRRRAAGRTSFRRSSSRRRVRARKGACAAPAASPPADASVRWMLMPQPERAQIRRIASRCAARRAR